MKILLHGCNGKMGQVMTRVLSGDPDMEVICGVDAVPDKIMNSYPVFGNLNDVANIDVDLVIDFSFHTSIDSILEYGQRKSVPLLICTTGFTSDEMSSIIEASESIPILHSPNMALGVNVVIALLKQAASMMQGFDVEIIDKYHNQKLDAPSGTALWMADSVKQGFDRETEYIFGRHTDGERRSEKEIGIHSLRGGTIPGEQSVLFAGQGEVVEIKHTALARDVFAHGAVKAAKFLKNCKPGFYSMAEVIGGKK